MPYVQVQDIRQGMDRKREQRVVGELGTAWTIKNGHLSRGGDIQRRKKFVKQTGSFPNTTAGLYAINETLYTTGYSAAQAGNVPPGVTHLLTQHPTPATAIRKSLDGKGFDGTLYAIIEFVDGNIYHYYGPNRVTDWDTLSATIGSNNALASALADAIDSSNAVSASSAGPVITITSSTAGVPFTISQNTVNNGVSPQAEVLSKGSFTVTGGTSVPGTNRVTAVNVNGVDVLGAPVNWTTSHANTATLIANQINTYASSPNYTAVAVGAVVTITAAAGTGSTPNGFAVAPVVAGNVTVGTITAFSGGVDQIDSESITLVQTQANVVAASEVLSKATVTITGGTANAGTNNVNSITIDGVDVMNGPAETLAQGDFNITGGTNVPGVNKINSVTVNGVNVLGAAVDHTGDDTTTAAAVAAQINSHTSSPNYTATSSGNEVRIHAMAGTGSTPNGFVVAVSVAGDVTTAGISNMAGGAYPGVSWVTSNSATAAAIAARINSQTTSPDYTATSSGPTVTISAASGTGAGPNGFTVAVTKSGNVTTTQSATMSGGVTGTSAVAQVYTATIGGTFETADQFTITINGEPFTLTGGASGTGTSILTFKKKLYSTASANLYFSALNAPTQWISGVDYGFINMASQTAGQETLTVAEEYQGLMVIFSENNIRIWSISEDSSANVFIQTLQNTGTIAPRSVIPYGANDVFYLAASGIRSIKARDSSNAAYVSDVGTPIDTHVREYINTLTQEQIRDAIGIVEPIDGRFWLGIHKRIYVLSYFPSAKISAWSYYDVDFKIKNFAKVNDQIFVRGEDEDGVDYLYLHGGLGNSTYPAKNEDVCVIELPYFSANDPAGNKTLLGFDIVGINSWDVILHPDPRNDQITVPLGKATGVTYGDPQFGANAVTPLFAITLTCSEAGPATLSALAMHYDGTFSSG